MVEWLRKKANKHSSKVLGDEARPSTESIEASVAADSTAEAINATAEAIDSTAEAQAVTEKAQAVTAEAVDTATEVAETSVEAVDTVGEESEITADTVEASTPSAPRAKTKRKMSKAIFIALLLFVALPAPGTGGWTGALIASLFDLPKKWSFLSIFLGVLLCGVIMCLASYGVLGFLSFLL
ncbi:MAG: small multi-drug export protein [Clostridia bacterium]|nr:small multi-drug export protein [Clostridia bacterium]